MSTMVVIISLLLVCQISSYKVIDRKSDEFFYFLTDPITLLRRDNDTLKCNYVNVKSASLLLKHKDYAVSFAKCENNRVYLVDGLNRHNNIKGFDFTLENFPSKINKIVRLTKTFTKPLDHSIEVVVPGKILVVGRVNIDGLDYSLGVWQINLGDEESVMVNNVRVNVTTTTKNLEENFSNEQPPESSDFTHQISKRSLTDYGLSEDEVNEMNQQVKNMLDCDQQDPVWEMIKDITKISWFVVVICLLCKCCSARRQERLASQNYIISTIARPGTVLVPTASQNFSNSIAVQSVVVPAVPQNLSNSTVEQTVVAPTPTVLPQNPSNSIVEQAVAVPTTTSVIV